MKPRIVIVEDPQPLYPDIVKDIRRAALEQGYRLTSKGCAPIMIQRKDQAERALAAAEEKRARRAAKRKERT